MYGELKLFEGVGCVCVVFSVVGCDVVFGESIGAACVSVLSGCNVVVPSQEGLALTFELN